MTEVWYQWKELVDTPRIKNLNDYSLLTAGYRERDTDYHFGELLFESQEEAIKYLRDMDFSDFEYKLNMEDCILTKVTYETVQCDVR